MSVNNTANKRTSFQIERDRQEIARRYLRGETQAKIGQALGMTRQMVGYDLRVIEAAWLQSSLRDFDGARAGELARIDQLECTYWEAWEESRQVKEISTTAKELGGKDGEKTKAAIRKEQRDGSAEFLAGVQWCIDRRCKLLGLDAPMKVDVEHRIREAARLMGLDEEEAVEEARRIINAANGR